MRMWLYVLGLAGALLVAGCAGGPGRASAPGQPALGPEVDLISKQQFAGQENEASRSEVLYQALLRKVPNDAETWFRLGNLYAANNLAEPAVAAYNRTLMADNSHARAWHNLAVIKLREAYAALIQAQMSVDSADEAMAKRIETLIEEVARISALVDTPRPVPTNSAPKPR